MTRRQASKVGEADAGTTLSRCGGASARTTLFPQLHVPSQGRTLTYLLTYLHPQQVCIIPLLWASPRPHGIWVKRAMESTAAPVMP